MFITLQDPSSPGGPGNPASSPSTSPDAASAAVTVITIGASAEQPVNLPRVLQDRRRPQQKEQQPKSQKVSTGSQASY